MIGLPAVMFLFAFAATVYWGFKRDKIRTVALSWLGLLGSVLLGMGVVSLLEPSHIHLWGSVALLVVGGLMLCFTTWCVLWRTVRKRVRARNADSNAGQEAGANRNLTVDV